MLHYFLSQWNSFRLFYGQIYIKVCTYTQTHKNWGVHLTHFVLSGWVKNIEDFTSPYLVQFGWVKYIEESPKSPKKQFCHKYYWLSINWYGEKRAKNDFSDEIHRRKMNRFLWRRHTMLFFPFFLLVFIKKVVYLQPSIALCFKIIGNEQFGICICFPVLLLL